MNTATALHLMPTAEVVEQKETALAVIPEGKVTAIFLEGKGIDALLDACEKKALAVTADATTAAGRAEIRSMAYLVTRTKTAFDAPGKALSAEYKEKPKTIDANRKRVSDFLENLQARVRKPLTDWEEAEKARVQGIKDRINDFYKHAAQTQDSVMVGLAIKNVEGIAIDDSWQEFATEAAQVKDKVLADLLACFDQCLKRESEAAELARLREEQAKRDQADREAKIAKDAAEKATREAEEKAAREKAESEARELRAKLALKDAEDAAAKAKADAERMATAAVEAEKRRVEAEAARAKEEQEKREADTTHRFRVNAEAVADIQAIGLSKEQAVELVYAVRDGRVRNMSMRY